MNNQLTILDGGMGREIKARLESFDPVLWSATAFLHHPQIIIDIHCDYIDAGAKVITTNNYTVVPSILHQTGYEDKFEAFTKQAGKLAKQAQQTTDSSAKIAGCIPPLQSSYRPDLVVADHEGVPIYQQIVQWLDPTVDLFLCESMSSIDEAKMALTALKPTDKPIWVSFILDDQHPTQLLSGESVDTIASELGSFSVDAILFNCCHATSISTALPLLNFSGAIGGYANSFKQLPKNWDHSRGKLRESDQLMTANNYVTHASEWQALGASIIGGCCGIGIEHIQALSDSL